MARRGGLGPQGHAAVQRAAATQREITASNQAVTRATGVTTRRANPSVISAPRPGESEAEEDLNWLGFDSSRVYEAAYAADSKQLFVRFVRPTPGHDEYIYDGVESNEWRNFRRSASPGRFVNRVLNSKDYHRAN
jgi:hypothetical protein